MLTKKPTSSNSLMAIFDAQFLSKSRVRKSKANQVKLKDALTELRKNNFANFCS